MKRNLCHKNMIYCSAVHLPVMTSQGLTPATALPPMCLLHRESLQQKVEETGLECKCVGTKVINTEPEASH